MTLDRQNGQSCIAAAAGAGGEDGYLLLGAIVAVALVMIALSVAAVKVSFALKREREVESARRADQYVRAIRRFYLKFGRYPGSVEQLENTNTIRFLRQKYVDPLTGKADYRLIIQGQNKTTPRGFFGEPLSGLPGSGPGGATGAAGVQSGGAVGGSALGNGAGSAFGASAFGGGNGNVATMGFGGGGGIGAPGAQAAASGAAGATASSTSGSSTSGPGSNTPGSSGPGSNLGPIMGVGSSATGPSILTVNEQTNYESWEFLYDPREEMLRQQGQLNQGVGSAGGSGNPAGLGAGSPAGGTAGAPGSGVGGAGSGGAGSNGAGAPGGTQPAQP